MMSRVSGMKSGRAWLLNSSLLLSLSTLWSLPSSMLGGIVVVRGEGMGGVDVLCGVLCRMCGRGGLILVCFFAVVCVALYKVSDNVYVQKAGKKVVFANFYFWQRLCQLLFLAEFCQRHFSLPKILNPV